MIFSDMPTSPTPIRMDNTFSTKTPCAKRLVARRRLYHACSDYSKQFQQTHVKSDAGYS
jgi:hypothetical protein